MKNLKTNIYFKLTSILVIVLLLLIPVSRIKSLITEREGRQQEAIFEVNSLWASEQTLGGPVLSIPYEREATETLREGGTTRTVRQTDHIHILPQLLRIEGTLVPQKRKRGIFEVVVYTAQLQFSGVFALPAADELKMAGQSVHFDRATLSLGLDDLRGIEDPVVLQWNDQTHDFDPGLEVRDILKNGLSTPVGLDAENTREYAFSFNLQIRGSRNMMFVPVGKITEVEINSAWPDPSFGGAFLPSQRQVNDQGFSAQWKVLHLNRSFPQIWTGNQYNLQEAAFGVSLLLPVDHYMKSFRSVKYAILIVGFTFLVFFFVEVLNKVFIHPIQYILVGMALIIFYTLLISISEHLSFNAAFVISLLATLGLVATYVKAVVKSHLITGIVVGVLAILYGFVFVIIQLQDFALLFGSLGLFLILALVMYFSRKIDWYNVYGEKNEED